MLRHLLLGFALAAGVVVFCNVYAQAGQMQSGKPAAGDFFPFSVWYSGGKARAPMLEAVDSTSRERWKRDLEQIKLQGFNTVRTWIEWTACEPRPGQYNFQNLELLSELAQQVGLKVIVQVYVDSAPDWVGVQFPDSHFVAQSGERIPSQSAPGFCFDHPGVRDRVLSFYREAAKVATRYPNFYGWDLWSEPHIINWAIIDFVPNATFCYCPSSMERFRQWLQMKYGSIQKLNEAWYRRFENWKQVEPPRFGTILSYTDFIDWRTFIQEKLAEDLKLRSQAVKSVDPTKVTTSHAAVPCLFTSPLWGVGAPDDWLMTESADYFGTSIYPKHSFPKSHWDLQRLSVLMDFARSAGRSRKGFYVGELQAGMGIRGTVVGNPVTVEDHRLWAWGLLSRGARAINVYAYYPMSSGYEAGGYGLINLDGTLTERSKAIGQIARVVDKNSALFVKGMPPQAEVAVVYNPLSYMVGGEQHLSEAGAVRDSQIGIYRPFWRNNIPIDFVHLREVKHGQLARYKLVFVPYPLMFRESSARALESFVSAGGTLVVEARCGWNDDRGYSQDIVPGFGLDQVFRVREGILKMQEKVEIRMTSADEKLLPGIQPGLSVMGRGIMEELLPYEGARTLASFSDGRTAMTVADFGKGRAVAIGSFVAMANGQEQHQQTEQFLLALAKGAGVRPPIELKGIPSNAFLEVRLLHAGDQKALFLFNHSAESLTAGLPFESGHNLETEKQERLAVVTLQPGEIKVYRVEERK
ncbi:MAG TPA: beta-galactosidase [Acidobacteriota bacterium]|mgnify:CR=1 FL=1|nr:beta-galactosidase [Acidobacteriota bacterium]